jgi:hypothetical protein
MTDVLRRLRDALPRVEDWIRALRARRLSTSRTASEMGFAKLATCFPANFLKSTRVVLTDDLPFPPVSEYGVPEFETMAIMSMAGITFNDMYFVRPAHSVESIHFHELVHVVQWGTLGAREFLLTYAAGFIRNGYEQNPLEKIALDLQARFDDGPPLVEVVDLVTRHADQARDKAAAAFRSSGLEWGA